MTATTRLSGRALRGAVTSARVTAELVWFMASAHRREDPYPAYRRLRRLDPAHHSPLGVWVLSSHGEVSQALRDPALSSNEKHIDTTTLHLGPVRRLLGRPGSIEIGPFFDQVPELLLFRDPPDHTRLRSQVNRSFTPRRVQHVEKRMQIIADELIDNFEHDGHTELMSTFAYPFPAFVICELIGVPAADVHHITDHAPALAAGLDPGPLLTRTARDTANVATETITDYLNGLIERRSADPADDLLSALLTDDGDTALTHDEVVSTILLLLIAGHETTANLLGNGLVALLDQPARLAELRRDPTLDAAAADELLRFDSPVQMTMRIATQSASYGGRTIQPGTIVILCTGAANHDETVFTEPGRLDWHRKPNPHLALGGGIHYCLGAPLARTEARIALRSILNRLPDLALDAPPRRRPSFTIRGLSSLELAWTAPAGRGSVASEATRRRGQPTSRRTA